MSYVRRPSPVSAVSSSGSSSITSFTCGGGSSSSSSFPQPKSPNDIQTIAIPVNIVFFCSIYFYLFSFSVFLLFPGFLLFQPFYYNRKIKNCTLAFRKILGSIPDLNKKIRTVFSKTRQTQMRN